MTAPQKQEEHTAISDLHNYLRAWRRWVNSWRPRLGYPSQVNFISGMRPTVSGWSHIEDIDDAVDAVIMRAIDAEIENLSSERRAALRLSYLNEILPAVFRSARWDRRTLNRITAEAELELIPRLRARGVVLGGR